MPLVQSFRGSFSSVLRDGQSAEYLAATDPVSGEVLEVEVVLRVMK
jgi:hypothetical protein